jgi:hypothetical protein
MKKNLLIAIALAFVADMVQAQTTTYGGNNAPLTVDAGYVSDYSPSGTIVLPDGSVTLTNSTFEHGNSLFQNDGSWTATGGLDLFLAASNNTISGSTAPSFFNVQFNIGAGNTMAITNVQGINVAGSLQFNSGLTTTVRNNSNTGALHFADGAAYTGGTTDEQHVDGYVSKTGNDAFTFPVGSGTDLRTLSISAPPAVATISTAWFAGSPATITDPSDGTTHSLTAMASPIKSVSPIGFWDWTTVSGSDDDVQVTVSIPDVSNFFVNVTDVRLVGWDGTQWISLSAGAAASGLTENSTVTGSIPAGTNITAIALGGISTPLPVTLARFEGKAIENSAYLQWTTTEEVNASNFEIQRSRDARHFEAIGSVAARGESKAVVDYYFTDSAAGPGSHYYRLKQIDLDNTYSFSRTIVVRFDGQARIALYPNPTADILRIEANSPVNMVEIFDSRGISMGKPVTTPQNGSGGNIREISLRGMRPGIYLVKVDGESFRIMKN